jgi:O-antigen/teichoic acid export membrane protein
MLNVYRPVWHLMLQVFPKLKNMQAQEKDTVVRTGKSIFMRLLRTGISFAFNVLLMRMLGAEGAGVYELAYAITRISTFVGRFGLDQAIVRFTAANNATEDYTKINGVYRHALMISTAMASLATVVVFLAAPLFASLFGEPTLVEPLRWMAFAIIPWSFLWIQSDFLQGIERTEDSMFVQTMGIPIVNIPFLVILTGAFGVVGAAMSYVIATVMIAFLGFRLWRRYTPQLRTVLGDFDRSTLLKTSMPLFWMDITMVFIGTSDTLLLGYFATSQAVGIYAAAKRISNLTSAFMQATVYVATPKFAAMYAKGEHDQLSSLARSVAKLTTLLALPYLGIFLLIPGVVMSIYGEEFRQGGIVLFILAIGQFINAATGATGFLLIMTGHEKVMRNVTFAANALKIALLLLMIPPMGYVGAALATMIGDASRELLAVFYIYRKLHIVTLPLPGFITKRFNTPSRPDASTSTPA